MGTPRRILVVDDNKDAAMTLAMLLRALGHKVSLAHSGMEALGVAVTERPEIVLLDIGLPTMNGYEVARKLRDEVQLTCARVIAVSGYGQEDHNEKLVNAGIDAYLVKPVSPQTLEKALGGYASS